MVKYLQTEVVFEEIPTEITLAINITNCQNNCAGCHSPYLREDIGTELTENVLSDLIAKNHGITCVLFMGEGNDQETLLKLSNAVKTTFPSIKTAIYSGRNMVEDIIYKTFDYVKVGEYKEECGPLNNPKTNQRLYKCDKDSIIDITNRFWKTKL